MMIVKAKIDAYVAYGNQVWIHYTNGDNVYMESYYDSNEAARIANNYTKELRV